MNKIDKLWISALSAAFVVVAILAFSKGQLSAERYYECVYTLKGVAYVYTLKGVAYSPADIQVLCKR